LPFTRNSAEFFWGDDFNYKLGARTTLVEGFRMFDNLSNTGQYRINFDTTATTQLTKWLTWNVSLSDRYLSDPAPGRKTNDFLYSTGLGSPGRGSRSRLVYHEFLAESNDSRGPPHGARRHGRFRVERARPAVFASATRRQRPAAPHRRPSPSFPAGLPRRRRRGQRGALSAWSTEQSVAEMDKSSIQTAILSVSPPGIEFAGPAQARTLARIINDYGAKMRGDHPDRFGLFAALPLPDTEGSLREIEYGLDTLKADGIGLMTNYGDRWLGDASFAPVWEELNRRKAVVYTHPNTPTCCTNIKDEVGPAPSSGHRHHAHRRQPAV